MSSKPSLRGVDLRRVVARRANGGQRLFDVRVHEMIESDEASRSALVSERGKTLAGRCSAGVAGPMVDGVAEGMRAVRKRGDACAVVGGRDGGGD